MPNMSITMLGMLWIGLLGSFAALILTFSTGPGSPPFGTDTLFLLALGVVANDVGALLRRFGGRAHPAAVVDQPEQDRRGVHRRHADDHHGASSWSGSPGQRHWQQHARTC
jgi:hypothetical protein